MDVSTRHPGFSRTARRPAIEANRAHQGVARPIRSGTQRGGSGGPNTSLARDGVLWGTMAYDSAAPDLKLPGSAPSCGRSRRWWRTSRDWDPIKRAIKPICTAVNADAALAALEELEAEWGQRYGAIIRLWRNAWTEFIPFLDYDTEIRQVICSTNAIWVFGSWDQRGRCFSGWRSPWPALTLNAIDASGLSWTRIVGLAAC
jgi:Transposase, Mutator family